MEDYGRIIYSLNVEDLQLVSVEKLGRCLTEDEVKLLESNLGDYINWYDLIEKAIENHIKFCSVAD